MVKPIDLSVSQEIRADGTRRTISLRNAGSSGADSLEIHVDLLGETDVPAPDVLDGFVIGVIFHAMPSEPGTGLLDRIAIRNAVEGDHESILRSVFRQVLWRNAGRQTQ